MIDRAPSIWATLVGPQFLSTSFTPGGWIGLLPVKCSLKQICLWSDYFCRYDESEFEAAAITGP